MDVVYILEHAYENEFNDEQVKRVGVYTSRENAEAALARVRDQLGFRDHQDGFEILEVTLNRDSWTEGFITIAEAMKDYTDGSSNP